jgi:hypothetical protein
LCPKYTVATTKKAPREARNGGLRASIKDGIVIDNYLTTLVYVHSLRKGEHVTEINRRQLDMRGSRGKSLYKRQEARVALELCVNMGLHRMPNTV